MSDDQKSASLLSLHAVSMEFLTVSSLTELIFCVVNRCVRFCHYHRAVFFRIQGNRAKFLGVSGRAKVDNYSETVEKWLVLVSGLEQKQAPKIITRKTFQKEKDADAFSFLEQYSGSVTAYWLPLKPWGKLRYGLWFERWGQPWEEKDVKRLDLAGMSIQSALERLEPDTLGNRLKEKMVKKSWFPAIAGIMLLILLFCHVPLRVVAPCEIIPKNPFIVTAPLSGVVSEVVVQSGAYVEPGAVLFRYDPRVVMEDLNIARQQVKILETGIRITQINALTSPDAKAELAIMQYKLKQEQIRLKLAEYRASQLQVTAKVAAEVIPLADPDEWRGRPVEIGEKVLMLAKSGEILLRIWISEADNVCFASDAPVKILFNAMPDESFTALLEYVAPTVTLSTAGVPSVMAEGQFTGMTPEKKKLLRPGLKGNAIIYGDQVSVAYWLLRKPWTAMRKIFAW